MTIKKRGPHKKKPPPTGEWLRVCQLAEVFPVFSLGSWKGFVARGLVPSSQPAESRARLVRRSDAEAFLSGQATTAAP